MSWPNLACAFWAGGVVGALLMAVIAGGTRRGR